MDGFLLPIAGFSVIYGRLAACREKMRLLLALALTLAVRRSGRLGGWHGCRHGAVRQVCHADAAASRSRVSAILIYSEW